MMEKLNKTPITSNYLPSHTTTEKVAKNATKRVSLLRLISYAVLSTSIILSTLLVITKDLVSIGNIVELLLCCFVALVLVWMVLQSKLTISLLDFVIFGILLYLKDLVKITVCCLRTSHQ